MSRSLWTNIEIEGATKAHTDGRKWSFDFCSKVIGERFFPPGAFHWIAYGRNSRNRLENILFPQKNSKGAMPSHGMSKYPYFVNIYIKIIVDYID